MTLPKNLGKSNRKNLRDLLICMGFFGALFALLILQTTVGILTTFFDQYEDDKERSYSEESKPLFEKTILLALDECDQISENSITSKTMENCVKNLQFHLNDCKKYDIPPPTCGDERIKHYLP